MLVCLTIINNSSQHIALFLAGLSVVGKTLQISESGGPLGTGRTFTSLVFHIGLLTVSPARTRPAMECTHHHIQQGDMKIQLTESREADKSMYCNSLDVTKQQKYLSRYYSDKKIRKVFRALTCSCNCSPKMHHMSSKLALVLTDKISAKTE